MNVAGARIFRYRLPLHRPMTGAAADQTAREGLLLQLVLKDGNMGWGDAAPLPGFSVETMEHALDALKSAVIALCKGETVSRGDMPPSASFALESALSARHPDRNMHGGVSLCALLAGARDEIVEKARRAAHAGFRAVKLKVGRGKWADEARLAASVRETVGPDVEFRLDANRAWEPRAAAGFARAVDGLKVSFVEEPLRDWRGLLRLYDDTGIPFALDETLQDNRGTLANASLGDWPMGAADLRATVRSAAACVIKPTLLHFDGMPAWLQRGGLENRPVIVSAAYESGVGIAALAALAAGFPDGGRPAGLDTYDWLAADVLRSRLPMDAGTARLGQLIAAAADVDLARLKPLFACGELP